MAVDGELTVTLEHLQGLEFKVTFDWPEAAEVLMDEPEPLGTRRGPNASRLLAAAVGNCLTASLLFCLQRSKLELAGARTRVSGRVERNEKGRLRLAGFAVRIDLPVAGSEREKLERCLGLFEDYCTVSASVRRGIPIAVQVCDRDGGVLHASSE
jgi:uncharacterized OsmC-like protein